MPVELSYPRPRHLYPSPRGWQCELEFVHHAIGSELSLFNCSYWRAMLTIVIGWDRERLLIEDVHDLRLEGCDPRFLDLWRELGDSL